MNCSCWMIHYNLSRSHRVKPATASPGSTMQTGLSSCTVGGVCVCVCVLVWLHMRGPPHSSTPAVPPLHFDHSLFSVHRANWVCACVTHSRLQLITLLYNLTDRWVFLWLTHSLKQARKTQAWFHTHRHTLQDPTESLSLYLQPSCMFV